MSQMFRVVVGSGVPAPGAHIALALRIADFARRQGFAPAGHQASRNTSSVSRYLRVRDRRGRIWLLRVSNHHRPANNPHAKPHLDLVSMDGVAGYDEACLFLSRAFGGVVPWFDPATTDLCQQANRARRKRR